MNKNVKKRIFLNEYIAYAHVSNGKLHISIDFGDGSEYNECAKDVLNGFIIGKKIKVHAEA